VPWSTDRMSQVKPEQKRLNKEKRITENETFRHGVFKNEVEMGKKDKAAKRKLRKKGAWKEDAQDFIQGMAETEKKFTSPPNKSSPSRRPNPPRDTAGALAEGRVGKNRRQRRRKLSKGSGRAKGSRENLSTEGRVKKLIGIKRGRGEGGVHGRKKEKAGGGEGFSTGKENRNH